MINSTQDKFRGNCNQGNNYPPTTVIDELYTESPADEFINIMQKTYLRDNEKDEVQTAILEHIIDCLDEYDDDDYKKKIDVRDLLNVYIILSTIINDGRFQENERPIQMYSLLTTVKKLMSVSFPMRVLFDIESILARIK